DQGSRRGGEVPGDAHEAGGLLAARCLAGELDPGRLAGPIEGPGLRVERKLLVDLAVAAKLGQGAAAELGRAGPAASPGPDERRRVRPGPAETEGQSGRGADE